MANRNNIPNVFARQRWHVRITAVQTNVHLLIETMKVLIVTSRPGATVSGLVITSTSSGVLLLIGT